MIKMLYANGCSLGEGSELGNVKYKYDEAKYGPNTFRVMGHLSEEHREHIETHSWPHVLKRTLGIEHHLNNSFGGSSNRRIVRHSITDIDELLKTYKPEEILVAIGWTSFDRFELYENQGFTQVVPSFHCKKGNSHNYKLIAAYDELMNCEFAEVFTRHLLDVICLKNYLDSKGIKYIFSYGLTTYFEVQFTEKKIHTAFKDYPELTKFIDMVDYKNWFFSPLFTRTYDPIEFAINLQHTSFYGDTIRNNYVLGNGSHPLEDSHERWGILMAHHVIRQGIMK